MKRRVFVKQISYLTSSVIASSIIIPSQKKSLGVALVGLGYYSRDLLAPALQQTKNCHLAGIVSGSPTKILDWQKQYNISDKNIYDYENMEAIVDNPNIDIIYIVLPTSMHSKYSIKASNAGKHVWCEKPMARTEKECQDIIDACAKNKVKLSIGYRMQHEPNTRKIMEWARIKPYGNIVNVHAEAGYYDGRTDHWKLKKEMGGGAMYDMGVYTLNGLRYSTGEEPISVRASHSTSRPHLFTEVDETTSYELEFNSGIKASGITSLGINMNRLDVKCKKGSYYLDPFQSYSGVGGRTSDGVILSSYNGNQQARQMDNDALAILNNTPVLVPGEEGLKDIRIVEAIYKSAASNSTIKF